MKVVKMDENLRNRLRESGLSQKMKSLEFCKFLIIEEENNVIVAATGIGGMFNVHSIQIADTHQGKGLGKKLLGALVDEAKKQGYSFFLNSMNPENTPIVKLVKSYGFEPLFRIHYSKEVVRDSGILILKPKGKTVKYFFRFFNTKGGNVSPSNWFENFQDTSF